MKEYSIPVYIPDFERVQQELLAVVPEDYESKGLHAFNVGQHILDDKVPTLMTWLRKRSRKQFRLLRFYVTPPWGGLGAHIDGVKGVVVPFGLNIPVLNCKNTYQIYYDTNDDNLQSEGVVGYYNSLNPKDSSKLKEIHRLEITEPQFTRNDILHAIENNNDTHRIMFTVRWILHPKIGRTIEEVFDLNA